MLSEASEGAAATPSKLVQVIRTGSYKHPSYGNFKITREHLDSFVRNFDEKVRGIDIAVDYKHESEAEAAGWFKKLFVEEDAAMPGEFRLMASVDWTPVGEDKLLKKEFRYLSADFTLDYVSEDSKKFGPVLLGAGLTNRPFIKGMEPVVQLSENYNEGDPAMTLEQAMKKIEDLEAKLKKSEGMETEFSAMKKKLSDLEADAAKLAEEKKTNDKKASFDKMLAEKKVVEAQRDAFMKDDFAKFAELSQAAPKEKKLSEDDGDNGKDKTEGTAEEKIIALAEKLVAEKKAPDLGEAQALVLSDPENKKLREEYEKQFC